jgi:predicted ThiF/HesA family dinucleotide-utilizing enzyme
MADIMYDRQRELDLCIPKEASVVGCGGVGAWVAIDLAMAGVKRLNLFDDDQIEMHNLNRVPFTPNDVGKPKTEVLQTIINGMRPDTIVYQYGKVTELTRNLVEGYVVDCTDKVETQKLIQSICKQKSLHYYRVGYDGHHVSVIDGQHADAPKAKDVWEDGSGHEGYTIINSWVAPPQVCASLVTYMICAGGTFGPINADTEALARINEYIDEAAYWKKAYEEVKNDRREHKK